MKNKRLIVALSILCVAVVGFNGCGKDETNSPSSASESTAENENTVSEDSSEDSIPEDDFVISWQDEGLTDLMRQVTGVVEGNICYGHVKDITNLDIDITDNGKQVINTIALKYLTNLKVLEINNTHSECEAVVLQGLKNLERIDTAYEVIRFVDMEGMTIEIYGEDVFIDNNDYVYESGYVKAMKEKGMPY